LATAVSARTTWRVGGDLKEVKNAVDGSRVTAAVSEPAYQNAHVTIDLGKPCLFNMVVIDHGPEEMGFCRRLAVLTSLDGQNYTRRTVGPGTRRVTILSLITPILARYVRLQVVATGDRPWSVGEVYVQ